MMDDKLNNQELEEESNNDQLVSKLKSTEDKLKSTEDKLKEAHDALLRSLADLENNKKRYLREMNEYKAYALNGFIISLMPFCDALDEGIKLSSNNDELKTLQNTLHNILRDNNIEIISPVEGELFDPDLHEAIKVNNIHDVNNKIVNCFSNGYKIGQRLLRPARVEINKKAIT